MQFIEKGEGEDTSYVFVPLIGFIPKVANSSLLISHFALSSGMDISNCSTVRI